MCLLYTGTRMIFAYDTVKLTLNASFCRKAGVCRFYITSRKFFLTKLRKGKRRGTTLIGIDVVPD